MKYPALEDFLIAAAAVLDTGPLPIYGATKVSLATSALAAPHAGYGDVDLYPDPVTKGAILCSRIVRNHPLPDGNKRVGWVIMRMFFSENGIDWTRPDEDEVVTMVRRLAGEEPRLTEREFVEWVQSYAA